MLKKASLCTLKQYFLLFQGVLMVGLGGSNVISAEFDVFLPRGMFVLGLSQYRRALTVMSPDNEVSYTAVDKCLQTIAYFHTKLAFS